MIGVSTSTLSKFTFLRLDKNKNSELLLSALSYYNGPFAGQEDEFALYDENGNKVETSSSKEEGSGE